MPTSGYTVFIVEDDQSVRDALGLLLGLRGYPVTMFADAPSLLAAYRPEWHERHFFPRLSIFLRSRLIRPS